MAKGIISSRLGNSEGLLLAIGTAGAGESQRMGSIFLVRFGDICWEQSPGSPVLQGLVPPGLQGCAAAPTALGRCWGEAVVYSQQLIGARIEATA